MEGCEYIVERVIARRREDLCFRGMVELCGLPACLCPPLTLCAAEATDIRSCPSNGADLLQITVCFTVRDSRGCRGEGSGIIQVESCACRRICKSGTQIRRSAELCIREATFCPPCEFCVCINVGLETLISRCEIAGGCMPCRPSKPACPQLPLYPPPCPSGLREHHEHFCESSCHFPRKRVEEFPGMM